MIRFFIPGIPVAKQRPKFVRRGSFVSTYTPKKTKDYEELVKAYSLNLLSEPLQGPLCVELVFTLPIPSSTSKKLAQSLIGKPHIKKPDLDNLVKSVLDGMIGIAFLDDGQVYKLTASKVYGLEPGVLVSVYHNPEHNPDNDGPCCTDRPTNQETDSSKND